MKFHMTPEDEAALRNRWLLAELAGEWFKEGVQLHASGQPIAECSNEHSRAGWRVRDRVQNAIAELKGQPRK